MSKGLIKIREGIDDVYDELVESSAGGVISIGQMVISLREVLAPDIRQFEAELIDATLKRLIHDVGRRRGRTSAHDGSGDLFAGYKRIPRTLLIREDARKSTLKMTILEMESYLRERAPKVVANDHDEMRRLITDCRKFAESDQDTLEILLRRQADSILAQE